MNYKEEDFLQLSALQHFLFCPRQCGLIHIEQQWVENLFTAEGRIMHEHVHESSLSERKGVKIEYGLSIYSSELGLSGKADVVEFHKNQNDNWIPLPVEYKRGKPKLDDCDKVQLCAQALCLEEMQKTNIPEGALFYGKTRHRNIILFDENLRKITKQTVEQLHEYINAGITSEPLFLKKCKTCSFIDVCMPETISRHSSVRRYLVNEIKQIENNGD